MKQQSQCGCPVPPADHSRRISTSVGTHFLHNFKIFIIYVTHWGVKVCYQSKQKMGDKCYMGLYILFRVREFDGRGMKPNRVYLLDADTSILILTKQDREQAESRKESE